MQVLEDVNNVPDQEGEDEIDDELLDQIAAKMIKDLEAANGDKDSVTTSYESNQMVDAVMKKVRQDLLSEDAKSERNASIVDALTFRLKSNLDVKEAENDTVAAFGNGTTKEDA